MLNDVLDGKDSGRQNRARHLVQRPIGRQIMPVTSMILEWERMGRGVKNCYLGPARTSGWAIFR
jgi:hypothetical protein